MPQCHGDLSKRKVTGGKKRTYRTKRRREVGSDAAETRLGEPSRRFKRIGGGGTKTRLLSAKYANVTNPSTHKTKKVEIIRVLKNPANVDYDRRGVITKGAIIKTQSGEAKVTSRPGQDGVVNAILIGRPKSRS